MANWEVKRENVLLAVLLFPFLMIFLRPGDRVARSEPRSSIRFHSVSNLSGYYDESILLGTFGDGFKWGAATAAYQVSRNNAMQNFFLRFFSIRSVNV